ncbi:MAG: GAF domain-containing protein [Acidimicrobiales bacterium]
MTISGRDGGWVAYQLSQLSLRLARCPDLNSLVSTSLASLSELFGYEHSLLLLLDEKAERLYTIASHGYSSEGVGSEVGVGEGIIGMAATRAEPMRIGNLRGMIAYARTIRRSYEQHIGEAPGHVIPLPGLARAESQVAVPAMVLGQLVGIVAIESERRLAFSAEDESLLTVAATLIASAIEIDAANERAGSDRIDEATTRRARSAATGSGAATRVKYFAVDGSTFLNGEYLIKGVAGRLFWALLGHYDRDGRDEFTNKEIRLDPSLELPDFRDNLESRLILLKRRLDEREATIRIEKTTRGRFRLIVDTQLRLECAPT